MVFSMSSASSIFQPPKAPFLFSLQPTKPQSLSSPLSFSFSSSFSVSAPRWHRLFLQATRTSSSSSSSSSSANKNTTTTTTTKKKNRKRSKKSGDKLRDVEIEAVVTDDDDGDLDFDFDSDGSKSKPRSFSTQSATPLPKPPAGFVVDETGRVLLASTKRIATIVDSSTNEPLDCVIRRIFTSSRGDECMLLCPVDTPVQILKSTNLDGWSAVNDEEVETILPAAAYALAKIHMHLVHSGFCYTARGGFCYSDDDIFDFRTDDGEDVDGLPTEGVEITYFNLDGSHYMIYTPSDPLLFVAVKDKNGNLQIADDDLLDDPAIISAIDEETEFNALVEEEAALLNSMMGKQ